MPRVEVHNGLLLGAGILLLAAMPVRAQGNATCTGGNAFNVWYGVNQKAGAPFSGTTKTTFEQTLADGNRIRSESTSFQARDSAGRVRTEQVEECLTGEDGQPHPRVRVQVEDPTTHSSSMWETGEIRRRSSKCFTSMEHPGSRRRKNWPSSSAK